MKTDEQIEFEKFMELQVEKAKAEHDIFMMKMMPRFIILIILAILTMWLGWSL